jgi:type VI protein secretion system component VasF
MELTQYKPLTSPGFSGQEGFFFCYALFSLGFRGRFKMVY